MNVVNILERIVEKRLMGQWKIIEWTW
jgi:hypothetical protein